MERGRGNRTNWKKIRMQQSTYLSCLHHRGRGLMGEAGDGAAEEEEEGAEE
jgi:hypothetical protein